MTVFGGAGGRNNEGRMQVDGLNTGAGLGGSGVSTYVADISNAQEVVTTTSGGLGEAEVGGPTLSIIPKSGGNTLAGNAYASGTWRRHGRQQLQPGAASGRADDARHAAQAVGLHVRHGRSDPQGPSVVPRRGPRRRAAPDDSRTSFPTSMPATAESSSICPIAPSEVRGAESWRLYTVRLTLQATSQGQDQRALGRAARVQRLDVQHQRGRLPPAAGQRQPSRPARTRRPQLDDVTGDRPVSQRAPARAAGDVVGDGDEQHAVRSRLRRVSGALRPLREPWQHHATVRARHRAVRGRVHGQWRHSQPHLSLAELVRQLGRAVHVARVGLVRDRCAQPEGGLRRRRAGVGPAGLHQRQQPDATRSTTACRSRSRRACCRSRPATARATCRSTCRISGRAGG